VIQRATHRSTLLVLIATIQTTAWAQEPNSWTTGADMPTAVQCPATGVVGGTVYVVSGLSSSAQVTLNQIYDPMANTWTMGAPVPTARVCPAGAVVDNIFYVIGGKLNGNQLKVVEAYDPATDTWSTNYSPMPTARDSLKAVVNNGIIYVIGGFNNGSDRLRTVESYNPATDTWTEQPPLAVGKSSMAVTLFGSTIVVAGGLTDSGATGDNEAFNLPAGPWKSLAPDPTPRWDGCSANVSGQLYYAGGRNNSAGVNVTESFNLAANQWTTLAPIPVSTSNPGEAAVDNLLSCFGGSNNGTASASLYSNVQIYHPGPATQPAINAGGVVSASAFGAFTSVAPGSWIEIYGSNLAPETESWVNFFTGINAPTTVDGTSVTIGGEKAFVDFVSPDQVDAQVPFGVGTGTQQITVETAAGTSAPINVTVNAVEPGLLAPPSFEIGGVQYAAALFVDNAYVLPVGAIAGLTSRPAKPGDTIVFYGVGFGPVTPSIPSGQIVQQANTLASKFEMSIGGTPATVTYDGLAPSAIGLYQFNVMVPNIVDNNAAPVAFTLDGVPGTQTLSIPVQN
jgi:uncharacterized protein (TIGR03437 family)